MKFRSPTYLSRWSLLPLVTLLGGPQVSDAATISGDIPSTSFATPSDLVSPAFIAPGVPTVETDAFTYGRLPLDRLQIQFTVDRGALGLAGTAVFTQATFGAGETAHADVFRPLAGGSNALVLDGDGSAAPPSAGPGPLSEAPVGSDNIDALEHDDFFGQSFSGSIIGPRGFWSVDGGTLAADPAYVGFSAADVFDMTPFPGAYTVPGLYAAEAALGLVPGDDIDALEVIDLVTPAYGDPGDTVLFSLAPGSPTDIALGTTGGSGGDIFVVTPGMGPTIFASAASLGLTPLDNVNGITGVPEPNTIAAVACISVVGLTRMRRRRGRKQAAQRSALVKSTPRGAPG